MFTPRSVPARQRVLVVDDVEVNRLIAIDLLNRLGIDWAEAVNGLEALEAVQAIKFDLILMDVQMPIMDGFAATAAIRSLGTAAAAIPIVAITAGSLILKERCLAAGMDDYLAKPIMADRFTTKVIKWLRQPKDTDPNAQPLA